MSATRTRLSVSTFGAETRQMRRLLFGAIAAALLVVTTSAQRATDNPREILDRAIEDFLAGRLTESVAGFDRVVALAPQAAPQLW